MSGSASAAALTSRLSRDGAQATAEPMSDRAVARMVQARVAAAGPDPALFGEHSLRAGFVTAAAAAGASAFRMREVSRHKSIQVLADYVRTARAFEDYPGGSCWDPGCCRRRHATNPVRSASRRARPRRRALCTNWKKPR